MSAEEELPEGAKYLSDEEAALLEQPTSKQETTVTETEQTSEPQTKADLIRIEIEKLIKDGVNLQDKDTYTKAFNDIATNTGAKYEQVYRLARKHLKVTPEQPSKIVQADNNKIKIETKEPLQRPKKTANNEQDIINVAKNKLVKTGESPNGIDAELKLEAEMIAMSLQAMADFEGALGLPAPQQKKIDKMSLMIATYNRAQISSGHPEKVMKVSERVAEIMLKLGIVSMFVLPVMKKYFSQNDKNSNKPKKETKSMR